MRFVFSFPLTQFMKVPLGLATPEEWPWFHLLLSKSKWLVWEWNSSTQVSSTGEDVNSPESGDTKDWNVVLSIREIIISLGDGDASPRSKMVCNWRPFTFNTGLRNNLPSLLSAPSQPDGHLYHTEDLSLYLVWPICWDTNAFTKKFTGPFLCNESAWGHMSVRMAESHCWTAEINAMS